MFCHNNCLYLGITSKIMKRLYLLTGGIILNFLLPMVSLAQSNFYYTTDNNKVMLTTISGKWTVEFPEGLIESSNYPGQKLMDKLYLVTDTNNMSAYSANYLVHPTYITQVGGAEVYPFSYITLLFNESATEAEKTSIKTAYSLEHIKTTSSYELYSCSNSIEDSKAIYETGKVKYCHPDYFSPNVKLHTPIIPNDAFFAKQFYLHNTGQGLNDGHFGTPNADINAPEAWDITLGSSAITIAVIDEGVTDNHPDLPSSRQIRLSGSNLVNTGTSADPSPKSSTTEGNNHGNACAGIIAASHNNIGVAGIAPNSKIMPIKAFEDGIAAVQIGQMADAIDFAVDNGADIISNSWGIQPMIIPSWTTSINDAISAGVVVIHSAGNTASHANNNIGYTQFPGNSGIEDLIIVGASDRNDQQADYSPSGDGGIDIVAPSATAMNKDISTEGPNVWTIDIPGLDGYNPWRDVVPNTTIPTLGEKLPFFTGISSPTNADYTGRMGGTSAAAPQVAGVAALMLSVNPCLSPFQVKDILTKTADKIGSPGINYNWNPDRLGHSKEMGYGRLNAHKAVEAAQNMNSSTLDLYVRDTHWDMGLEALTPFQWGFDISPDIWVRNQTDGLVNKVHEDPEYQSNSPVYVYVRVSNKSCVSSLGASGPEKLALYWTKAATGTSWPLNWDGTDPTVGNQIGSKTIPALAPGESAILRFTWNIYPNTGIGTTWGNCLMARIENSVVDPILTTDVAQSNNLAMRNTMVTNYINDAPIIVNPGGDKEKLFYIGNPHDVVKNLDIIFRNPEVTEINITDVAEVNVVLDQTGWNLLLPYLQNRDDIEIKENNTFSIIGNEPVAIENINFPADTRLETKIIFNFLTDDIEELDNYRYHVLQKNTLQHPVHGDDWVGGVHFTINKSDRIAFDADAGSDKIINIGQSVTLSAAQINEPVVYNWTNLDDGTFIATGREITVSPNVNTNYQLEVISEADAFKDYDEVTVQVTNNQITSLSPNPASSSVTVGYEIEGNPVASLQIVNISNPSNSVSYPIANTENQKVLDITNLAMGVYTIGLVVNNQIVDAKTLSVE